MRASIHMALHFIVPALVARWVFADRWIKAWVIMMLAMAIDIDHLLATPIFDPDRCGIGFHPLHTYPAMILYGAMFAIPKLRVLALGLMIHVVLDGLDCVLITLK